MRDLFKGIRTCSLTWAVVLCGSACAQLAPIWRATGGPTGSRFGYSVSRGGDVNGDGYEELVVGAPWGRKALYMEGLAFVFRGGPSGLDSADYWTDGGNQISAQLGWSVAGGGDLNGDGYDDVIAGAPYHDAGQTDEGAAFVYYGSADGLPVVPDLVLQCDQAQAMFGNSVAIPGDVNGDGFDDLLVGAPYYDDGPVNEGTVFLYYGSPSGLGTTAVWTFETEQWSAYVHVHPVGDLNGDGFDDVGITSLLYEDGETDEGRAFLFYGSASGPGPAPSWAFSPNDDYSHTCSMDGAGDVNGDGYPDLVVGAHGFGWMDGNLAGQGAAFLFLGSGSGPSEEPAWLMEPNTDLATSFGNAVAGVGDVDGDGLDDVVVCDEDRWGDIPSEGGASLYTGILAGLSTSPLWEATGGQITANYGRAVCGRMDTNGNGVPEWLIGAPYYDNVDAANGVVFLYEWTDQPTQAPSAGVSTQPGCIVRYNSGVPFLEMSNARHPAEVFITDVHGQTLLHRAWDGNALPLVGLSPGMYVVSVLTRGHREHHRIIIGR